MFSHVMVGSNDIDRSKKFYDALFGAMGGKPGVQDAKGRLIYAHNGGLLMVSRPIDGKAATHANGGTVGFKMASQEQADAWHKAGVANGDRGPARHPPGWRRSDLSRLSARSRRQQTVCGASRAGCLNCCGQQRKRAAGSGGPDACRCPDANSEAGSGVRPGGFA